MNRWLAILILSFGTAILVAQAAIPHHHHEGVVCYHHDEEKSQAQETSHQHGPSHPLDFNCSLKQLYVAPSGKKEIFPDVHACMLHHSPPFALLISLDLSLDPGSIPLKLLSYHTLQAFPDPIIILSGPRAPPLS